MVSFSDTSISHQRLLFWSPNKKKTCLYFLDEMSLAAAAGSPVPRLKIKTRLFLDQQPTPIAKILSFFKGD